MGVPQIIQVITVHHGFVLKPMVTWGSPILETTNMLSLETQNHHQDMLKYIYISIEYMITLIFCHVP